EPREPMVYRPSAQAPGFGTGTLALRSDGAIGRLGDDVRRVVRDVAPNVPVYSMIPLEASFDHSIATERLVGSISAFLGATALLLIAIGVYGTLSYSVAQRTREMGVRVALGATGADLARLVLKAALVPVCAGIAVGLPAAFSVSRAAQSALFEITSHDPVTYVATAA